MFRMRILEEASLKNEDNLSFRQKYTRVEWDNTSMMENVKYCNPPRFLIVEDNVHSRMSMKFLLKKLNKNYQFDNAANGKEAIQKFKNLFNRG